MFPRQEWTAKGILFLLLLGEGLAERMTNHHGHHRRGSSSTDRPQNSRSKKWTNKVELGTNCLSFFTDAILSTEYLASPFQWPRMNATQGMKQEYIFSISDQMEHYWSRCTHLSWFFSHPDRYSQAVIITAIQTSTEKGGHKGYSVLGWETARPGKGWGPVLDRTYNGRRSTLRRCSIFWINP
jgi:hypothetical protein